MVIKSHLSKRKLTWNQKKHLTGLLFLLPQSAFLAVFIVYPLASVIFYSLFDWNGMSQMKFVGADNYKLLPGTEGFWDMAKATVIYAAGVGSFVRFSRGPCPGQEGKMAAQPYRHGVLLVFSLPVERSHCRHYLADHV